ncbi:MAG TPA: sulfatase [Verrucomicrobiae bacterium]|nr:sulfatase [Verrucomicrobiae bacterium]
MHVRWTLLALLLSSFVAPAPATDRPPNFVIIYIDDMGYADIGPFGARAYKTPNLDRLAKEGRVFTDFYVSQAVCSASRAALMTGCHSVRIGILGALGPQSRSGIGQEEITLGEIAKQKGYATACFGKWHLGHLRQFLPLQHGFDEYFGLPYSNDMWPYHPGVRQLPMEERLKKWPHLPLIEGNDIKIPQVGDAEQNQLTTWYTQHAVAFIEKNKGRPFLLYVPHSMVHVPLHVSDKFRDKSGAGLFGDVVMEVDWSVGQIVEALRRTGLDRDTCVVFASDNGPWLSYGDHAGSALPLREGKGTMFDGGCRVPCIMWWPGKIPAGTTCREPAMTIDILPTIAGLIGAKLPDHKIDGLDIWPLMCGRENARSPHEFLSFYWGESLEAVRSGNWKLHFPHKYRTLGGKPGGAGGIPVEYATAQIGLSLFDLAKDPGETTDVAAQHPDVVRHLEASAGQIRQDLGDKALKIRGTGIRACGKVEATKP